ncbi:hypothetical protein DAPPUDRAFT_270421 [Daphnia pulex]|uniref:Uncharacterized protein n=1 Tax=Daphnia pulex TaxID=6669 RepID=E9I0P6_DAPPU|nr:hypothetical protein DAPPUDRAFT_270421 [Daphnia pulex]|eukprot:EFX62433.1 hypothetical protein DAPPUDRAFT_270421 [Daphnia pulex]
MAGQAPWSSQSGSVFSCLTGCSLNRTNNASFERPGQTSRVATPSRLKRGYTLKYYTEAPKYYTTNASETTQLRMLPQTTTPRLQLITPPKLSNTVQERPSTIEISRVSFSNTQHGSPEVSNKLRFKQQWNGKE